ncbi:MAG TPA: hypothetical protein VGN81_01375 [Pseudonocardiaceae bacterium]|jgi:hypothetical protein
MNTKLSRRARLLTGAGAILLGLTATACTSSPGAAPAPDATARPSVGSTTAPPPSRAGSTATATPRPTTPAPKLATKPEPVPTLGVADWNGQPQRGYGTVRPNLIDNGGDPTGIVTGVRWQSWGGPTAIATGMSSDPGNGTVADSVQRTATVTAFDLGVCHGKLMYRAVEWYFPSDGQKFDPNSYTDICTGNFVGRR